MINGVIVEHDVIPIIRRIHPRRIGRRTGTFDALHAILRGGIRVTSQQCLIVHFHVIDGIHHLDLPRWHTQYCLVTNRGVNTTFLSFFCRNQNNPVRPTSPVHGGCRSVFHHAESFNIFRCHTRKIQLGRFYTINQDQGIDISLGLEGSDTTNVKFGIHFFFCQRPGDTSRLPPHDTGDFPSKLGSQVTT